MDAPRLQHTHIGWLPVFLAVLATMSWAGNITLAKWLNASIPPIGLAFWRWSVAAIVLLPFVIRPMRKMWPICRQHLGLVFTLSLLGVAGYNTLIYIALKDTLSTNVLILQSSSPLMILLAQFILLKQSATTRQILAISVSAVGVLLIVTQDNLAGGISIGKSEGIALFAILIWASYSVLVQKLPQELKGLPMLGYTVTLGAVILLPFYVWESVYIEPMPLSKESVFLGLYTGIFASAIAFFCWNSAITRMGASRTGQFMHLIPVFGLLFSALLLGEKMDTHHLLGIGFIVVGIVIANTSARMTKRKAPRQIQK
ncbi:DMT family transporter [Enterovibrio sp. ZSDZ35]|uniref:DMT family transporter n=1 Tax=Enterovibrio qingdaonensis TaxID=2899818 RepID=A0ABT5QTK8_9GAMM|nr:DMT family transporter [Enterovibrio sp. ZSDZ35]MDD1784310.1 DMT family transporter [Enterovibrio sp. ZSDZ35]